MLLVVLCRVQFLALHFNLFSPILERNTLLVFANDGEICELPKKDEVGVVDTLDCLLRSLQANYIQYILYIHPLRNEDFLCTFTV